ncbi:hypothetical protein PHMEG_0009193 [Phytophthora megakarya]|uniref:Ubiquitin-like protease family profile domain-containing protein n=1 Tax=Phytophthora megakarya TaxID=4795 RepID=A0A225WGT4_9STRA|nr:hypothetical protein PHMEG_0009193 [Phytophthora megakarya]
MHKWLTVEDIPALPADCHDIANKVAAEVLETYPYAQIQGLPNMHDFVYSMLYRATPPTWLTDASIRALCLRLADDFSSCRFAGFQTAVASTERTRNSDGGVVDQGIRERVMQDVDEGGVETVLLPLNFHNAHCARRIYYYDPLNQTPYLNASNAIATQLKVSGLQEYEIVQMNNPLQFDAYSCGVYVCWIFVRLTVPGPPPRHDHKRLTTASFRVVLQVL